MYWENINILINEKYWHVQKFNMSEWNRCLFILVSQCTGRAIKCLENNFETFK